jgi:hypothetical protein
VLAIALTASLVAGQLAAATPEAPSAEAAPEGAPADHPRASAAEPAPSTPAEPPPSGRAPGNPPVVARSNETMEFSVSYLGIPMGKARITVGDVGPAVAPVFLLAQTSSVLSFITIRQHLSTYLDLETGLPRSAAIEAVEGSYRHTDTVQFDRVANKATVRVRGKYDNTNVVDVPPGTTDFVGLVFRLRALPLAAGDRHEFPVLAGNKLKTVTAEVVGRESLSTKVGEFQTVKVRVPTGLSGKFSEKNPTHVWFSDDARRIVVRIQSDFAIGHATAGLVAYTPGAVPPAVTAQP